MEVWSCVGASLSAAAAFLVLLSPTRIGAGRAALAALAFFVAQGVKIDRLHAGKKYFNFVHGSCVFTSFFSIKRSLRSTEIFAATLTLFGSVVSLSFGGVLASKKPCGTQ